MFMLQQAAIFVAERQAHRRLSTVNQISGRKYILATPDLTLFTMLSLYLDQNIHLRFSLNADPKHWELGALFLRVTAELTAFQSRS